MKLFGPRPVLFGRLALLCLTSAVAATGSAQVAGGTNSTTGNAPPPGDTVGPRELRNFSLGGTPQPSAPIVAPDRTEPRRPTASAEPTEAGAAITKRVGIAPTRPAPRDAEKPRVADDLNIALPPPTPITQINSVAPEPSPRATSGVSEVLPDRPNDGRESASLMPWLIALLVLGGAALAYAFRGGLARKSQPAFVDGLYLESESTTPADSVPPVPLSRAPSVPVQDSAPPARPLGIVSTKMRPWLDISFEPTRAVVDERSTSVQFDVIVTNSGNAPARQVLVEATMINAGSEQDAELRRFFESPVGTGERVDSIPPLTTITLQSAVTLPLDQVRAYEVGGRRLFVPVVAFNALYEWSSGKGQSSASFILGRGGGGGESAGTGDARMAPLRLDLGPRLFRDLDARRHPVGMRV